MGGILGTFWSEAEDEFQGLTEDETKQLHQEIKREYSNPKWSSVLSYHRTANKWNNLARVSRDESRGSRESSVGKTVGEEEEDKGDAEKATGDESGVGHLEDSTETVEIGVEGTSVSKALLRRVIQRWESLESEGSVTQEEGDNVCNTLEELREESENALAMVDDLNEVGEER